MSEMMHDKDLEALFEKQKVPAALNKKIMEKMDRIDQGEKAEALYAGSYITEERKIGEDDKPAKVINFRKNYRKAAAIAASIVLAAGVLQIEPVKAAMQSLLAFIPGIGFVEEEKNEVMYYLKGDSVTVQNEQLSLTLRQVYVTEGRVEINYELSLLGKTRDEIEEALLADKSGDAYAKLLTKEGMADYFKVEKTEGMTRVEPVISLEINGQRISSESGGYGSDGMTMKGCFVYTANGMALSTDTNFSITLGEMTIPFKVRKYDTVYSTEEIGASQVHNDIAITAVPSWEENKLRVDLYTSNGSPFDWVYDYGYDVYDEKTDTYDEKTRPYVTIEGQFIPLAPMSGADGTYLEFDLTGLKLTEKMKEKAVLHIPAVTLQNNEKHSVKIKIDKNEKISQIDQSVKIEGGTLTVVSGERIQWGAQPWQESNYIKLTLEFEPEDDRLGLNSLGALYYNNDNGYSWEADRENNRIYAYINYDKGVEKIKKLTFDRPEYIYYDEYELALK